MFSKRLMCQLLFLFMLFFYQLHATEIEKKTFKYNVSIAAIFNNEAPYLKEWIEFHRLIGVDHFYLFNHNSTDDFEKVLKPYISKGIVDLIDWPVQTINGYWGYAQTACYNHVVNMSAEETEWLAVIDIDEFIVPVKHKKIGKFLSHYKQYGGLVANWVMFGTSHIWKIPHNRLLIESLLLRSSLSYDENHLVKSIVQPRYVDHFGDAHHAIYKEGYYQVNSNSEPILGPVSPKILTNKIRIHHYWTRDKKYLKEVKVARRLVWGESGKAVYKRAKQLNKKTDFLMLRYVPELRKKVVKK